MKKAATAVQLRTAVIHRIVLLCPFAISRVPSVMVIGWNKATAPSQPKISAVGSHLAPSSKVITSLGAAKARAMPGMAISVTRPTKR